MEFEKKKSKSVKIFSAVLVLALIAILVLVYITQNNEVVEYVPIDTTSTTLSVKYSDKDLSGEWSEYTGKITLSDTDTIIEGSGITNSGNTITINKPGTFYITGSVSDGNIVVNTSKTEKVQLVLDNASITSKTTAPINGIESDKITITLADNSVNTLTDATSYTTFTDTEKTEPDAALFTKTDLVINGNGKLVVNGNYLDGIASKDSLKIINATVEVNSKDDGIRGKDYIALNNATLNIKSGGDGLKSTNSEDETLGYIAIESGTITIDAGADGIQAETIINISDNPTINITTNGEIEKINNNPFMKGAGNKGGFGKGNFNGQMPDEFQMQKPGQYPGNGQMPDEFQMQKPGQYPGNGQMQIPNQMPEMIEQTTTIDSASSKGLKAKKEITINNGSISINSTDDSIHSNGIIIINDGVMKLTSGDDGIHADTNIVINGGNINIDKSYEGIESAYIEINAGEISVVASDDGINVAGGNDSSAFGDRMGQNGFSMVESSDRKLVINGGNLFVSADGDGLDANGSMYINGGNTVVSGTTASGNGALDYDQECVVTGGNLIVYGGIGMWQNPSSNSTQYVLTFQASGKVGDNVSLKDSSGKEIATFKTEKAYGAITISVPEVKKGSTYTLYVNGQNAASLEANSIISSNFSANNNFMMQMNKGGKQNWK